ncbi:OmpA family protein [Fibrobacter sp. UWB7]|jgi:chemotaxis protein MotB|uniref:OmpA/MotB family protein n=1 Tax=Fibrobacter sp. UWB7 TaxID=1896206 RepID=UPI00091E4055|nr:OmpA family protein [Fibrobacter sp. UWB7]SHN02992.1 chemotaxis protein MotB [Fibrobacter sp. UWB7]
MKEKPNPFVSISDLMSGITAVVMLLLVVMVVKMSVMKQAVEEEKRQNEIAAEEKKRKGVRETIEMIDKKLRENNIESVSVKDSVITLNDQAFERGSACLSGKIDSVLKQQIAPIISEAIREHNNIWVQFEGHTDAVDVHGVSASLSKCAVFDDNYSLSAGRAREARKAVLSTVQGDAAISRRISVVGYGPDQLKNEADPNAAENRRVEIRLVAR